MRKRILLSIMLALMYSMASAQTSLRQLDVEPDTLYKHIRDIIKIAYPMEEEYRAEYCMKFKVPKKKINKLSYYIYNRKNEMSIFQKRNEQIFSFFASFFLWLFRPLKHQLNAD